MNTFYKKVIVFLQILVIIGIQFAILGNSVVEAFYAGLEQQSTNTNQKNIDFDVYFKNGEEKVHYKEADIKEGGSLIVNIMMNQTGVLDNAKISLENSNFNLKEIENAYVKSIEDNEIELNQIISGEEVKIEIPIQFKEGENITKEYLSQETTVKLEGSHISGEKKKKEIVGEKKIKVDWKQETQLELQQEMEKYITLEGKTLLQQKIITKVNEKTLIKEEKLEINVPEIQTITPDEVNVLLNGEMITDDKYEYNKESKILTIKSEYNKENIQNEYKIIYLYGQTIEEETLSLKLYTKVNYEMYTGNIDVKEYENEVTVTNRQNQLSATLDMTESLYKGYLYSNSERVTNYQEKLKIEISNLEELENICIQNMSDYFKNENGEKFDINGNAYLREIKFFKTNLQNILGEKFEVNILGENGENLAVLNEQFQWNENGEGIISLDNNSFDKTQIVMSSPVNVGVIDIEMSKYIKGNAGYTKDELKSFTNLESNIKITSNNQDIPLQANVILNDTITEAKVEVNTSDFSVLNSNQNVQIIATLKSDNEKYNLYENPIVRVKLPDDVETVGFHFVNILYGDEMKIAKSRYSAKDKIIEIRLEGKQSEYRTTMEEGIKVVIDLDINLKKDATDKEATVDLMIENAGNETFETNVPVKIKSKYGAILYQNIEGFNEENTKIESAENDTLEVILDKGSNEKQAKVKQALINNYDNPIDEIVMIGNLAEESEESAELKSNFKANLINGLDIDQENVKVYYSEKENATEQDDTWNETVEDWSSIKSFKITMKEELAPKERLSLNYGLAIPANLQQGDSTYQKLNISYLYQGQKLESNSAISLMTTGEIEAEGLEKEENGIKTELIVTTGNKELKDDEEVWEGQTVNYKLKVTNNTGKDLNNLNLVANHTNVIYYGDKEIEGFNSLTGETETIIIKQEDESLTGIKRTADTLKAGETIEFTYQFAPKKITGNEIKGMLEITADDIKEKYVITNINTIKDAKMKAQVVSGLDDRLDFAEGDVYKANFYISNLTNEKQTNVIYHIQTTDLLQFDPDFILSGMGYELQEYKDNKITIKIPVLEPNQKLQINLPFIVGTMQKDNKEGEFSIYSYIEDGKNIYYSNKITKKIKRIVAKITGTQSVDKEESIVKVGDILTYVAKISNNDNELATDVKLTHNVTEANSKLLKANIQTSDGEITEANIDNSNLATIEFHLEPGETITYIAEVEIWENTDENVNYEETVKSNIRLEWDYTGNLELNEITFKLFDEEDVVDPDEPTNPEGQRYQISGKAWEDKNKNGIRDNEEYGIPDLEVQLLDAQTGEIVNAENQEQKTVTDKDGNYVFNNISNGKYIVVFRYNNTVYSTTQYQKENIDKSINSDVIQKKVGEEIIAVTDTLKIEDENLKDIDAGFIKNIKFDMSLDKTISKVIVQNAEGTRNVEYKDTKLAKVEINPKYISNTTVLVEYKIKVKNEGEIPGYANEIVDYMPKELKFNSEINKNWYMGTDGNVHNMSLSNTLIKPGETQEVKLTLIKQMTAGNTGITYNIAEILEDSNDLRVKDEDSVPGNRKDGEDDISSAELLVSIKTGLFTISISIFIIAILGIIGYVIYRERRKLR